MSQVRVPSLPLQVAVGVAPGPSAPPPSPAGSSPATAGGGTGVLAVRRPAVLGPLVEAQPQRLADDQALHDEGGAEPRHGVLGGDQSHEVVAELRVVPGTGVELAQQQPRAELPQVRPQRVDEAAQQHRTAGAQPQVHALHDQDAGAVDEERPHAGHAGELPVAVDHKLPGGGEHDLAEVAVDGVEVPAGQGGQRDGSLGALRGRHARCLGLHPDAGPALGPGFRSSA